MWSVRFLIDASRRALLDVMSAHRLHRRSRWFLISGRLLRLQTRRDICRRVRRAYLVSIDKTRDNKIDDCAHNYLLQYVEAPVSQVARVCLNCPVPRETHSMTFKTWLTPKKRDLDGG